MRSRLAQGRTFLTGTKIVMSKENNTSFLGKQAKGPEKFRAFAPKSGVYINPGRRMLSVTAFAFRKHVTRNHHWNECFRIP